jgi:hypothetical protein
MPGRYRFVWPVVVSLVLASGLVTVPLNRASTLAVAADACTTGDDVRATTCRLQDGATIQGSFDTATDNASATYRLDLLGPGASVTIVLYADDDALIATLRDWRGATIAQDTSGPRAATHTLTTTVTTPGVYALRVAGWVPDVGARYALSTSITYPEPAAQPYWPPGLATPDAALTGERQVLRTPRGGTPQGGVAVARALRAPPQGDVGDFELVADVQFEQIVGPSAFTVRFRYEPEAGGGTGYILEVDPFGGTALLDGFDSGERKSVVAKVPLPVVPTEDAPNRLVLQATGPNIQVSLDGQPVLEATDNRYPRGLVVVGAVTWSDPVAVTFDHLQVTASAQP